MLKIAAVTTLLVATLASTALAMGKGTSMIAVQLGVGTANLYDPSIAATSGYISSYEHSEDGVQLQYWNLMSDDYAFTIAGGLGFFSEEDKPGTAAAPGSTSDKYTQTSYRVRVGGDRVVSVGKRAVLYFGPGVEFWSGKSKLETVGLTLKSESTARISLSGRMGGTMMIGSNWGFTGDMGHLIGHASAEDHGAKASWWPSSLDAHGGLLLEFGGSQ